jgi:hypothetical protein
MADSDYISLNFDRRRGTVYPSPFFDISQTYMPPTVKELFRWCQYFFIKEPLFASVVSKIAEYPVTDFIYNAASKHVRDAWKDIFEEVLNLKPFLIEVGLDYFCYGNAFISINFPFNRWIKCKACGTPHRLSDPSFEYRLVNFEFQFRCRGCEDNVTGEIHDVPVRDKAKINFVRWDPKNIDIYYNPLTGRSKYRYKIPNKVKRAVMDGSREILIDIPKVFFEALKQRRDIALSDQNLFHFKRPTLAEQDMGWGKPLILHSMSRMFYLHVLRRAQEAIALQRIMPLEFVFPQANAQQDPYQHVNLGNWQFTVQEEIRKWRVDPNYISVVAVPLGFERLGGDGRALLLGPEIEVTNKEITGGMGVPIEFVFGGLSWSGSSVSLRTLENHFLLYRRLLLRFVNWVKNRLRLYLNLPDVAIGFTEFKMADDIQRKQMVIQLNAANKISDHTLLTELGFDYDEEQKAIQRETEDRNRIQALMMKAQTQAQGEAQIEQAKYQVRSQQAYNEAAEAAGIQPAAAQDPNAPPAPPGVAAATASTAGAPGGAQDLAADAQMAQQAAQQTGAQQEANVPGQAGTQAGAPSMPLDASRVAKDWANALAKLGPMQQQQALAELRAKMPNMASLVMRFLSSMGPGQTAGQAQRAMRPLPQMKPPQREASPV